MAQLWGHIWKYLYISLLTKFSICLVNILQKLIYSEHMVEQMLNTFSHVEVCLGSWKPVDSYTEPH